MECRLNWLQKGKGMSLEKGTWPEQVLFQMQADENTDLSSKIRSMRSMRFQFWLYDCGLFERTMAVSVSRSSLCSVLLRKANSR